MKRNINLSTTFALIIALAFFAIMPAAAQGPNAAPKNNNSKMLYHNGPVLGGTVNIYLIWYGCWRAECGPLGSASTQIILADLVSNLGSTPYFQINTTYPNLNNPSQVPSGGLFFGGGGIDLNYSHGNALTESDISGIIVDQVLSSQLPVDPSGVYIVIASEDISANDVGFCQPGAPASFHGNSTVLGTSFRYGFIGHAARCPSVAASQFVAADGSLLPTPNGDLAADAMASNIAHVLSTMVTNPMGEGWYDRYGLENATKCQGTYGQTYTTANGARANLRLGYRDFLIQQNWVNDKRGRCALSQ